MKKYMVPLAAVFILVSIIVLAASNALQQRGVDTVVVLVGNSILFLVSALTYLLYAKALNSKRSYGFVKQVYAGFTLKFFALIICAMLYFYFAKEVNKPAIFICMGLYLVYNFLGTSQVVRKKTPPALHETQQHQHPHHSKQQHRKH